MLVVFKDARQYDICYEAVVLGEAPAITEWDDVRHLLRKLHAIGQVSDEVVNKVKLYKLNLGNDGVFPTLVLERSELAQLLKMIERPIWRPTSIEAVLEVRDMLKALQNGQ